MEGGEKTILIADHSKFNKPSFAKFSTLKEIDTIITDTGVSVATPKWLSRHAGKIKYVETPQ